MPLTKSSAFWMEELHAPKQKHATPRSAEQGEARAHNNGRSLGLMTVNCLVQAAIAKLRR